MFYCLRNTHDCLCILLGKTQFSHLFGFSLGYCYESVFGFLGFGAVPCEVSGSIAIVAIQVFGLEPIDLHWVDLLDLLRFVLHSLVVSHLEPPLP